MTVCFKTRVHVESCHNYSSMKSAHIVHTTCDGKLCTKEVKTVKAYFHHRMLDPKGFNHNADTIQAQKTYINKSAMLRFSSDLSRRRGTASNPN